MNNNIMMIGFCKCARCGWDNGFNWHTYFICPECGSKEYIKEDVGNEQIGTQNIRESNDDFPHDIFYVDYVSGY